MESENNMETEETDNLETLERASDEEMNCDHCDHSDLFENMVQISDISDEATKLYILDNVTDKFTEKLVNESVICKSHVGVFRLISTAKEKSLITENNESAMTRRKKTTDVSLVCDLCNKSSLTTSKVNLYHGRLS